jgi:hypothetical protein
LGASLDVGAGFNGYFCGGDHMFGLAGCEQVNGE